MLRRATYERLYLGCPAPEADGLSGRHERPDEFFDAFDV